MKYKCTTCGEEHDDLPDLGAKVPDYWYQIPVDDRETRVQLTTDTCVIDRQYHFIRGVIEIPLIDADRSFGFGVWVSQAPQNFRTYVDNFDSSEIGPFMGWLSTQIAYYPTTINLKTKAHFRGSGQRPWIELEPTDHPLSIDYHKGMSIEKAWKIVHHLQDLKSAKKVT